MNICFFMHHSISNKDGASISVKNVSEELVKRGHTVYIVYPSNNQLKNAVSDITIDTAIRSYSMRIKLNENMLKKSTYIPKILLNKLAVNKAYNYLKDKKIDLVHINGLNNEVGAMVAKKLNVPYVWHIRAFLEEDLGQTLFNYRKIFSLLYESNSIIGISKSICEKYENKLGRNIDLVYNGVPLEDYMINNSHAFKDNKTPTMILAGRISAKKGQMDAVRAVKILRDRGFIVKLKLFGYGVDDYFNHLVKYIEDNDLKELIEIKPYSSDLRMDRFNSDIGLTTSVNEAFGRITVENFLSKILCIGSDTGGTAELIGDRYGILYRQGDEYDLADKIEYSINKDNKEKIDTYINDSFNYALNFFPISRVVDDLESIYLRVQV